MQQKIMVMLVLLTIFLPSISYGKWIKIQPLRQAGDTFLSDIVSQCPNPEVYRDSDTVTTGHESVHGVNSRIRNMNPGYNGYYFLNGDAYIVRTPKNVTLSSVAWNTPQEWRGKIYNLYLIQQQQYWNDSPLYVLDECTAYLAGACVGIEINNKHRTQESFDHALEMFGYARVAQKLAGNYPDSQELDILMDFLYDRMVYIAHIMYDMGWYTGEHDKLLRRVENRL